MRGFGRNTRRKILNRPQMCEEMDKISSLPDSIRSQIASYLPTIDALRTSILSKQWRYVSHSLPNLSFDQMSFVQMDCSALGLKECVNKVLRCHDGTNIESFRLRLRHLVDGDTISPDDIYQWISFGQKHNFCEFMLMLTAYDNYPLELPPSLFTCSTLSTLNLGRISLVLPTVFCLPVLKELILDCIVFSARNETVLSCRCPLLKKLDVKGSKADMINVLTISVPDSSAVMLLKILDCNVDLEIRLSIPNLSDLIFSADKLPVMTSETLSSPSNAKFCINSGPPSNDVDYYVSGSSIIKGMHKAYELTLSGYFFQFLSRDLDTSTSSPTCHRLEILNVNWSQREDEVFLMTSLVTSFPSLTCLKIQVDMEDDCELDMKKKKKKKLCVQCTGNENAPQACRDLTPAASTPPNTIIPTNPTPNPTPTTTSKPSPTTNTTTTTTKTNLTTISPVSSLPNHAVQNSNQQNFSDGTEPSSNLHATTKDKIPSRGGGEWQIPKHTSKPKNLGQGNNVNQANQSGGASSPNPPKVGVTTPITATKPKQHNAPPFRGLVLSGSTTKESNVNPYEVKEGEGLSFEEELARHKKASEWEEARKKSTNPKNTKQVAQLNGKEGTSPRKSARVVISPQKLRD